MLIKQITAFAAFAIGASAAFMFTIAPSTQGLILAGVLITVGALTEISNQIDELINQTRIQTSATIMQSAATIDPAIRKMIKADVKKFASEFIDIDTKNYNSDKGTTHKGNT